MWTGGDSGQWYSSPIQVVDTTCGILAQAEDTQQSLRVMIYKALAYSLVWPLQALTPLCFVIFPAVSYNTLLSSDGGGGWVKNLILGYTGAEIIFYGWFRYALGRYQVRNNPPITTRARREELWQGIRNSGLAMGDESPYYFLRAWFSVPNLTYITRSDLKEWLAWALFDRQYNEITDPKVKAELNERISEGEKEMTLTIPDQTEDAVPAAMRLNVDPVVASHRPLIYYTVTELLSLGADVILMLRGFRRHRVGPVYFWVLKKDNKKESNVEPPLVFVHGVGIGLSTYLPFLLQIASSQHHFNRTIVLIELPHVSMKLNVDVIPRMEVIAECAAVLFQEHSLPPALWVAHSLGTFVFAVVNRLQPSLVAGVVLLDPVCFLLWEPDLLRNFCYCTPETPMQIIQNYHICRELSISHYFHRHFFWHECVQFANEMPARSLVYISECDNIYNTKRVIPYLQANGVSTRVLQGHMHGGWMGV